MDNQNNNKRSNGLAIASLIMGILSLTTTCCIYAAIPFASLAIIFSLLSRGGEAKLDSKSMVGLLLGIIGLILTILVFVYMFIFSISYYGGLDNLLQYSNELTNQYLQMCE